MNTKLFLSIGLLSLYGASVLSMKHGRDEELPSYTEKKSKLVRQESSDRLLAFCRNRSDLRPVSYYIAQGADVNAYDNRSRTCLHYASGRGDLSLVKTLLDQGASVDGIAGMTGHTALHSAAVNGHMDVCEELISRGASVHAQSYKGWTPLHSAVWKGQTEVAKLLLANGASLEAQTSIFKSKRSNLRGYTPLHLAVYGGYFALVQLFLEHNVNILATTSENKTVSTIALENGYKELAVYLESLMNMVEEATEDEVRRELCENPSEMKKVRVMG